MPNSLSAFPLVKYLTQVREELMKVTWPSREQTMQKTALVIGVSLAVGAYIGLLDAIFTEIAKIIIR